VQDIWNDIEWAEIAQKAALALLILLVTWIVARLVRWLFAKLADRVPALQRSSGDGENLGSTLGSVASLLVWLFGLVALLQVFGLDQVLTPIQSLLTGIMGFLPNLIGAVFVFVIGALLAKVVRQLIETALGALPLDRWFSSATSKVGAETGTGAGSRAATAEYAGARRADTSTTTTTMSDHDNPGSPALQALPKTIATVVYALIMIVVAIAALQILGIASISDPAEQMLTTIFDAIPLIIAAALILGLGVMIARFAGDILQQILEGLGTDRALASVDILPEGQRATPVIAKVVQIAIVLFFAVMAAQLLDFPQITEFLTEVLALGGRVLFGGAIIAVGFFIANLLAKLASGTASTIVRYATLGLFVAMGLSYMGIADSIIELAFGALVVGGAATATLAFGLGGRDAAARRIQRMESSDSGRDTTTSTPSHTTASASIDPGAGPSTPGSPL
jgi:hypothetical protein